MTNYLVVIPVLNQLKYTKICVESLLASGAPRDNILVINNGSIDGTADWLRTDGYNFITNKVNLGCGGAWTQGALLAREAEWVIFLNNDVVLCDEFCSRLIAAGEKNSFDIVSPAMVENELDYDFEVHAKNFVREMADVLRPGRAHGVCFAVRTNVFYELGFPDTDRSLGGHEDLEFFFRCQAAGKSIGTVGSVFIHHYGSITQKAMKAESGLKSLGQRKIFYRKVGMGWLRRKIWKITSKREQKIFSKKELATFGLTLHMIRHGKAWTYL